MANDVSNREEQTILSASSITQSLEFHQNIQTTKQNDSPYVSPLPSLVIDLLNSFRTSLGKIIDQTKFYQKQFSNNNGLDECFFQIRSGIEMMDLVLNNFLQYDKIVATIRKTNTVHNLIEKALEKHQTELEKKDLLVFRRFENNLPEVTVRDDKLAYILDSALQYILALMPSDGGVCFSTRSLILGEKEGKEQTLSKEATRYVEILMTFTGYESSTDELNIVLGMQRDQTTKDLWDLILQLLKDMVNKNRGVMKFGVGEEKKKAHLSLIFPVEKERSDL
jgi:hypothetical protein